MHRALVVFAHPYPHRSRANVALLSALEGLDAVTVSSLYDKYPDFDVEVPREQALLVEANVVVLQHPLYWYAPPALLKHWFDRVLSRGFAYGDGGTALVGKRCLWVTTTGGDEASYATDGLHERPFDVFIPPIEQTARFCKMRWEAPIIVHGAHKLTEEALLKEGAAYRARIEALLREGSA